MSHKAHDMKQFDFDLIRKTEWQRPITFAPVEGSPNEFDMRMGVDGPPHRIRVVTESGAC